MKISLSLPEAQVAWIDGQRGDVTRSRFVQRLVERASAPLPRAEQILRDVAQAGAPIPVKTAKAAIRPNVGPKRSVKPIPKKA